MQQSVAVTAFQYLQRFGRVMLVVCSLAILIAFSTSLHSRPASATSSAGPAVTVANTPLPVTGNINATVSGPVAISGTPNVNAAQSGTWTVGISGTPTVNLGSTGTLPVTAAGDPSSSAFAPVSASGSAFFGVNASGNACGVRLTNPASTGQVLVIENVGAEVFLSSGQRVTGMQIAGAKSQLSQWVPSYQYDDGATAVFGTSQAMRFYVLAGDNPAFGAFANTTSASGSCSFSYSGYVVNVH